MVAEPRTREPHIVVVMGVSGSGKSTVARGLAHLMSWEFAEGDDFHSDANIAKMAAGRPLTDADRLPWLETIGAWISRREAEGRCAVVACSALRRAYRDVLRDGRPHVRFLHVTASAEVIEQRLQNRRAHYMPVSLLPSQIAVLEPLADDEPGVEVANEGPPDQVLRRAVAALGLGNPRAGLS